MKIAVIGSRKFDDYNLLASVLDEHKDRIKLIVSGGAKGADKLAELYADRNKIPKKIFEADWNNLDAPGAVIRVNKHGQKFNHNAGFDRNKLIVDEAEVILAFWDGVSGGTKDALKYADSKGKFVRIENI